MIAKALITLMSKEQPWTCGREQQEAFETMKQRLGAAPIFLCLDVSKFFRLHMDWSSLDLGAILTQKDDFS